MTPVISALLLLSQSVAPGIDAYNRGDYAAAEKALRSAPEGPAQRVYLALVQAATGRCPEAETLLRDMRTGVDDLERLSAIAVAQCRVAASDAAGALAVLAPLLTRFPKDPDLLYLQARAHMRGFNAAVERMFAAAPASYRVNQLSAEVFELQGQFAEAVGEYQKAIAKNPRAVNLHYRLGRALLMQSHDPSQLDPARAAFEQELKINPQDAFAEFQVAQILDAQGNAMGARERWERALRIQPDFVAALIALGKKGGPGAMERLERAVQLEPKNETARYALMIAYRNAGRTEDARRQKQELDQLQRPPDGEFSDFLKRLGDKPVPKP